MQIMNKLIIAMLAAVCASGYVMAQGTTPDAKGTIQSPAAADGPKSGPGIDQKTKEKLSNAEFIEKAAIASLAEVKISNLALDKSATPSIREFANTIVKDHTAANKQLKEVAAAEGMTLPLGVDQAHTEVLQNLSGLSGRDFDAAYVNVMKQDHDSAIALFENAAGDLTLKPALREFATNTLQTLRNHQLQAHNLPAGAIKTQK